MLLEVDPRRRSSRSILEDAPRGRSS
ncbi:hypothetical protein EYF80_049468 [Liparis tanakae]|uniref:Uncharacterized protein n=1 Tax=Liparis tanakae TaxID=230148 RepID=A0A4Z2FHH3_9TELE|nr:hypothetical protein EYF80_049468 [Liparis tanakae]